MEKVTYPLSTRYRPEWGDWESVREIVQNAIDTKTEVSMSFEDGLLTVIDKGEGFEMKHLLIGETSKDGETSIGKFGEGLKFALLALVRQGREVSIRSNMLDISVGLSKMFDQQVLTIYYDLTDKFYDGTKVEVLGLDRTFKSRFLSLEYEKCMKESIVYEMPGCLFVKGIFVKNIKSLFGYNIITERENPLSGDIPEDRMKMAIANVIKQTQDKDFITTLLKSVEDTSKEEHIERNCGSAYYFGPFSYLSVWKEAIGELWGDKVCRATDPGVSREIEYRGFKVIHGKANFINQLIRTDREALSEEKVDIVKTYEPKDLSSEENEMLNKAYILFRECGHHGFKIEIVDFVKPNTLGSSLHGKYLRVSKKAFKYFSDFLSVAAHEYIHYWLGYADLTAEFQNELGDLMAEMVEVLAKKVNILML
jgi:hypothetical protein